MNRYQNKEFNDIISHISNNKDFLKLKSIKHHGITRYEHSLRVAYYSYKEEIPRYMIKHGSITTIEKRTEYKERYKITKLLHLDYKETTEAALLHDFFQEEVADKNFVARLRKHPKCALKNATDNFDLSEKQMDIIKSHMFPITFTPPKYLESWIVDVVDDISAIKERGAVIKQQAKVVGTFLLILLFNY